MTNRIAVGLDVHGRRLDVDDEPSTRGKVAVHRFERSQGAVAIRQKSERSGRDHDRLVPALVAITRHVALDDVGDETTACTVGPALVEHRGRVVVPAHGESLFQKRDEDSSGSHRRFEHGAGHALQAGQIELDVTEGRPDRLVEFVSQRGE